MKNVSGFRFALALALLAGYCPSAHAVAVNVAWLPVTDAERQLRAPTVDKDAGVEALFWRVHVMDEPQGRELQRVLYHYVRLKIFNAKGQDVASKIEIEYENKTGIQYITGRTIKADGTIVELTKDAIHEKDVIRASGYRRKVKSFSMPAVEPGAIVEYRWKETRFDPNSLYLRLQVQREYPIQKVTYFLMPLSADRTIYRMFTMPFHCSPSAFKVEPDGFNSTSVENVPAFKEESLMPGEPNVRPWILIGYHKDERKDPDKYWHSTGKEVYNYWLKPALHGSGDVKQEAAKAVAGVSADADRMNALIRFIRASVRDLYSFHVTDAERAKIIASMPNERLRTAAEVYRSGIGSPDEMNLLFASMAKSVGLDARPVLVADSEDVMFDPKLADIYFLSHIRMGVKVDGRWRICDVAARLLPSNMLSWREEGMKALVSDSKEPLFIDTPLSAPDASQVARTGIFNLDENGALSGDLVETFTGFKAYEERREVADMTPEKRNEYLRDRILKVYPSAEVATVVMENPEDPEKPLQYKCHVRIEGYAQRTGKRIMLQPVYFQRGRLPRFPATERHHPVQFRYGWRETDNVSIRIPEGFELDHPDAPANLNLGKGGAFGIRISIKGGTEITCNRTLVFGNEGMTYFDVSSYPVLKRVFDEIHRADGHTLALRRKDNQEPK